MTVAKKPRKRTAKQTSDPQLPFGVLSYRARARQAIAERKEMEEEDGEGTTSPRTSE